MGGGGAPSGVLRHRLPTESSCSLPLLHCLQLSNLGFLDWRTALGSDSGPGFDQPCGLGLTSLSSETAPDPLLCRRLNGVGSEMPCMWWVRRGCRPLTWSRCPFCTA